MLHKSFLSIITRKLLKRNNFINMTCYSTLNNSSHVHSKETSNINTMEIKEIEKIKLKASKNKKEPALNNKEKLDIISHIQNINPDIIDICPKTFMKISAKDTNVFYLIDRNNAKKFVSMIIDDLLKNMCFVAELNPGFGVLTTELLKAGVPLIHLYEAKTELHSVLNKIHDIYPGRLDLRHFNLIKISQLLYVDRETDGEQVQKVLQGVETNHWEDKTCMQIIGATSTLKLFKHLIYSLLFRNGLMAYGRPVFYIAIPASLWHKYTCDNNDYNLYTCKKVIFQAMFDYKLLGILDRKAFLPWPKMRKKQGRSSLSYQIEQMDYNEIYVIKLEPKSNIYSTFSQEDWIVFWYFLRHNMRKRCNRVIPELEKWVPGCGLRLIAKDYTIFTQFGELTPEKLVNLFKEFKSWPEYKTCNFLTSMSTTLNTYNEPALLVFNKNKDDLD